MSQDENSSEMPVAESKEFNFNSDVTDKDFDRNVANKDFSLNLDFSRENIEETLAQLEKPTAESTLRIPEEKGFFTTLFSAIGQAIKAVYLDFPKGVAAGVGLAAFGTAHLIVQDYKHRKYKKDVEYPDAFLDFMQDFFKGQFKSAGKGLLAPANTVGNSVYNFSYNKAKGSLTVAQVPYQSFSAPHNSPHAPLSGTQVVPPPTRSRGG